MCIEIELQKTKLYLKGAQENCKLSWMPLAANLYDFWWSKTFDWTIQCDMQAQYIDTDPFIIPHRKPVLNLFTWSKQYALSISVWD